MDPLETDFAPATDGEIAAINQASARQHAWSRFWCNPERPGLAEFIVEQEGVALEFFSDFMALDRLGRSPPNSPTSRRNCREPP